MSLDQPRAQEFTKYIGHPSPAPGAVSARATSGSSPQKDILWYPHLSYDILRYPLIRISQRICFMDIKGYLRMDINMDIKGYLLLISKDIFLHSFISFNILLYPAIHSYISNCLSIHILLLSSYIHTYPDFYPALLSINILLFYPAFYPSVSVILSMHILLFILVYSFISCFISCSFYPCISCFFILLFIPLYPSIS